MLQPGGDPDLPEEALRGRGGGEFRRQQLERHLAAELGVLGTVDLAHPALAEPPHDPVVEQARPDQPAPVVPAQHLPAYRTFAPGGFRFFPLFGNGFLLHSDTSFLISLDDGLYKRVPNNILFTEGDETDPLYVTQDIHHFHESG